MYTLRPLDPQSEQSLFRLSYNWRRPKHHTQPDRMSFEAFAADVPNQLTVGLFNGELQAVYVIVEWKPRHFEVHMTSARSADYEAVRLGAQQVLNFMLDNGAEEVTAFVVSRNKPLRKFVESIGFKAEARVSIMSCADVSNGASIGPRNQRRSLVKYAARV